nr:hypothetical protein [Methylomarinum sp. Ch1-1]MDP4519868.1 hypothetical protein [Methylomarinum sp. Ch1-1]
MFSWDLLFSRDSDIATILAEPNLTTISGRKAAFLSGGEFPYAADCSLGNCEVDFKKFGVGLEFTPIVLDANRISLKTHVSVSSLTNDAAIVTEVESVTPSLSTREADTTLELADGQTMSIAGLISEQNDHTQQHTPGLADLPLLGSLFRNRQSFNEKKELVILVTPHLARPIPRHQIRLPTDNYVQPDDIDFYLLGRMEGRATEKTRSAPTYNPSSGGTVGQFGHQINAEGM